LDQPQVSSRNAVIVPLIVGAAQFMHQFDAAAIANALPSMAQSLNTAAVSLNLAITCYLLALAVFVPVSGWMADRYGAKKIFTTAIVTFAFSSAMCGLSHSLFEIVVWRTIQGMGGAMMTPVGRVIVAKSVPKFQLVQAMNYITIPAVLGPVLGPPVGGFVVTYFSWHWIFFINVPIAIAGIFLVRAFIPDIREEQVAPLDLRGFVLLTIALAGLVFGFSAMGRGVLPVTAIIAAIATGTVFAGFYLSHARVKADPIIDLRLLHSPTFRASIVGGSLFYAGTVSSIFLLALLLQIAFGRSAFQAGLVSLASAAGAVAMRFSLRPILRRTGFKRMLIGNACVTGAFLIGCGFFSPATPLAVILVLLFIGGFSRSVQFTGAQTLAYADMPPSLASRVTSFSAMVQQLSQSFGVGLAALVVDISLILHERTTITSADISFGYFTIGTLALASILLFLPLHRNAAAELSER